MISREQLIAAIEQQGLKWYAIPGTSPYAPETLLILSPEDAAKVKLYHGYGKSEHAICAENPGRVFEGHLVAVKEVQHARWTRPGYSRGRWVTAYRVVLDALPENKKGYVLYREVEDAGTLQEAAEAGVPTLKVHGEAWYENILLVAHDYAGQSITLD